jgi:hypothetical protein
MTDRFAVVAADQQERAEAEGEVVPALVELEVAVPRPRPAVR